MSKRALSSIIFLLFTFNRVTSLQEDYYWREYTGTVPADAVVAGTDINTSDIYIGQAYDNTAGLIPVQIYPGVKEVVLPIWGKTRKVDTYIKILCGPQENFYWLPVNAKDLHLTLLGKHAVIGGHVYGRGHINIGRISHQGETKIGRILSYAVGDADFWFDDHGKEGGSVKAYEILMYRNDAVSVNPRIKSVASQ